MSKRFSETEKWKDQWFAELKPTEKLVFLYIVDNCDNAGFFELNSRINSYLIGITEKEYLGAIEGLNRGLLRSKNGQYYWVKNFLLHQKNLPLNSLNNAHRQIIKIIQNFAPKFDFDFEILGAYKGLASPTGKGNGKGKEKGMQGEKPEPPEEIRLTIDQFAEEFETYKIWLSVMEAATGKSIDWVIANLKQFVLEQKAVGKSYNNWGDLKSHALNWLKKQKTKVGEQPYRTPKPARIP